MHLVLWEYLVDFGDLHFLLGVVVGFLDRLDGLFGLLPDVECPVVEPLEEAFVRVVVEDFEGPAGFDCGAPVRAEHGEFLEVDCGDGVVGCHHKSNRLMVEVRVAFGEFYTHNRNGMYFQGCHLLCIPKREDLYHPADSAHNIRQQRFQLIEDQPRRFTRHIVRNIIRLQLHVLARLLVHRDNLQFPNRILILIGNVATTIVFLEFILLWGILELFDREVEDLLLGLVDGDVGEFLFHEVGVGDGERPPGVDLVFDGGVLLLHFVELLELALEAGEDLEFHVGGIEFIVCIRGG